MNERRGEKEEEEEEDQEYECWIKMRMMKSNIK